MSLKFHVLQELFTTAQKYPQKIAVILDDQAWTYSELIGNIACVVNHLQNLQTSRGQIIYQYMDRGFEMVCGLFGILCADGVYCSIDPTEPADRLVGLLQQIKGHYVLLHTRTRHQFPLTAVRHMVSLDVVVHSLSCGEEIRDLPTCSGRGAAYIICTSGTSGRQKLVLHTHKSFSASGYNCAQSNVWMHTVQHHVLQVASCSWALHLREISMALIMGGTLVLLQPGGHLNMTYFIRTLARQQVTTLLIGPAMIRTLTNHMETNQQFEAFQCVRRLCTTGDNTLSNDSECFNCLSEYNLGEAVKPQQWARFMAFVTESETEVFVQYGLSECNAALLCLLTSMNGTSLPMGYPFPGVQCLLVNEQGAVIDSADDGSIVGEIHIGG